MVSNSNHEGALLRGSLTHTVSPRKDVRSRFRPARSTSRRKRTDVIEASCALDVGTHSASAREEGCAAGQRQGITGEMETAPLPWVEKYRPRTVSDVAHQEEVVATLQKAVDHGASRGDLPHLLLYGPPGTGKTSVALALCQDLFGKGEGYKSRVLELNASDERGIKVVRDKIKSFAQRSVSASTIMGSKRVPPFKIIVLDEADAITADAQTALRRTMEAHSKTTRFILICNYVSRIIGPLASRCAKFRFRPLPQSAMLERIGHIVREEKIHVDDDTLRELIESCDGDLRKAITTLQSTHRVAEPGTTLTSDDVAIASCRIPTHLLDDLDEASVSTKMSHKALRAKVDKLVADGYSTAELLTMFATRLAGESGKGVASLNQLQKSAVAITVAQAEMNLISGGDEVLQIYSVVSKVATAARNPNNMDTLRGISC